MELIKNIQGENEEKFKTLEKKATDEMEMAEKKNEEREKEEANQRLSLIASFKYNMTFQINLMNDGRFMKPSFDINSILFLNH